MIHVHQTVYPFHISRQRNERPRTRWRGLGRLSHAQLFRRHATSRSSLFTRSLRPPSLRPFGTMLACLDQAEARLCCRTLHLLPHPLAELLPDCGSMAGSCFAAGKPASQERAGEQGPSSAEFIGDASAAPDTFPGRTAFAVATACALALEDGMSCPVGAAVPSRSCYLRALWSSVSDACLTLCNALQGNSLMMGIFAKRNTSLSGGAWDGPATDPTKKRVAACCMWMGNRQVCATFADSTRLWTNALPPRNLVRWLLSAVNVRSRSDGQALKGGCEPAR